jgi:hypothetical protein
MTGEADHFQYQNHPSILNRFHLEQERSPSSNFSIYNGNKLFEKDSFDSEFIQHFKAQTKHEKFQVDLGIFVNKKRLELRGNLQQKNSFLPMDTYVPITYFTDPDIFLRRYNFAHK